MDNMRAAEIISERIEFAEKEFFGATDEYFDALKTAVTALRAADTNVGSKWTAVSDGLPKLNKDGQSADLLLAIQYGTDNEDECPILCAGYYLDGAWWTYMEHDCDKVSAGICHKDDKVVAWCPQPDPPHKGVMI